MNTTATAIALLMCSAPAATEAGDRSSTAQAPVRLTLESAKRERAESLAPSFRLHGDEVSFPLVVVKGIPFIEATVNGVAGKLMLDTGAKRALSLNSNRIPMADGQASGSGFFGSGQRYTIQVHDSIAEVEVGGFLFRDIKRVESQDARMLEHITPDFTGWIGFDFWRGYSLKLDYANHLATFYRNEASAEGQLPKYLTGETVLGVIPYETRKLPNIPLVKVQIGSQSFQAAFDTGNSGYMWIDDATRSRLISDGNLKPVNQEADLMQLEEVTIEGAASYAMSVGVLPDPFPAAGPIGVDPSNILVFGHSFLSQFKTVWDFERKIIYLTEKSSG